jgi:hypothetical protein
VSCALVVALFVVGAIFPVAAADRTAPLAVDDIAPDFSLVDQHGQRLRLGDLLKTRDFVVVAFYVKAFTGG